MGVDIHMSVISKEGEIKIKEGDLFSGRNSCWFNRLMDKTGAFEYDHFPSWSGIPEKAPKEIEDDYNGDFGYYGFNWIVCGDFIDWFYKYNPHITAGWVTTYEAWAYKKKGITPEESLRYKPEDDNGDYVFIEYEDTWEDCSKYIVEKLEELLKENKIKRSDIIVYYFDC